jgi:hypothetical protein
MIKNGWRAWENLALFQYSDTGHSTELSTENIKTHDIYTFYSHIAVFEPIPNENI